MDTTQTETPAHAPDAEFWTGMPVAEHLVMGEGIFTAQDAADLDAQAEHAERMMWAAEAEADMRAEMDPPAWFDRF